MLIQQSRTGKTGTQGKTGDKNPAQINWRDQVMEIQCSSGICRAGGVSYEQLYQQADAALYAAKRRGKGRIHWSAPEPPDNARGS